MTGPKETPVMRQFREMKQKYPGTLLLYRMGDFYETFGDDAKIASSVLGIALTKRANGAAGHVPLAGFPYHALDNYMHKLLAAGHRVAVCEQVEDPKLAKGIVKRDVIEIATPGTALSDKFLNNRENNYLAAVHFGKQVCGLALLDFSTGEFRSGEFEEQKIGSLLQQISAREVLVSDSQQHRFAALKLANILVTSFPEWVSEVETAQKSLFEYFNITTFKGFGLNDKLLAIQAAAAALYYVKNNYRQAMSHISRISAFTLADNMEIDQSTMRNLEIFQSQSGDKRATLVQVLDKCITATGSRLLRKYLRYPSQNQALIDSRLRIVDSFYTDHNFREETRSELKKTADMERIFAKIATDRVHPNELLLLALTLEYLEIFSNNLPDDAIDLRKKCANRMNCTSIIENIRATLTDDPPQGKKGGFIKNGFSKDLDDLREVAYNSKKWMQNYLTEQQNRTGIQNLKIAFNRVFGYYLEVSKANKKEVPEDYIRKQTLTNSERYFTAELKAFEEKHLSAEEKIQNLESKIFQDLRAFIIPYAEHIQRNAQILAQVDLFATFAELAIQENYCRPKFTENSDLLIKNSRHPVVEKLLPIGEKFVSNDVELDCHQKQISLITGPNMSGKSTYLRQVGLLVLMAQIGSYVPADSAVISVCDKLFTRVGASDNLAGGESTFLVEMAETANILNNATPKSLIILDEIGRGTATSDGLSIAWAVTEYLHNNAKVAAKTLFATHFHELVDLADNLDRAFNMNISVREYKNRVVFLRKIVQGPADKSYGIHVAQMAGLPMEVLHRANEVLQELSTDSAANISAKTKAIEPVQLDLFNSNRDELRDEISAINPNNLAPVEALLKLIDIKKRYDL